MKLTPCKSRIIRVKMWLGHGMLLCLQMTQNYLISLLGVNKPTLSRIVLTEMGVPVLTLSNGKSYTYNPNMVCWWVVLWILSTQNFFIAQNKTGQIFIFKPRYINLFFLLVGGGHFLQLVVRSYPFFYNFDMPNNVPNAKWLWLICAKAGFLF